MRLYLDVDGVLLTPARPSQNTTLSYEPKDGVAEFVEWATSHYDCYWLTAWARHGYSPVMKMELFPRLPKSAERIKFAKWGNLKIEGIQGDGNFCWIDDNLLRDEDEWLTERGWRNRFVQVDAHELSIEPVMAQIKAVERAIRGESRQ